MAEKVKNDPKFRFPTLKLVLVEIFRLNLKFEFFSFFQLKMGQKEGSVAKMAGKRRRDPKKLSYLSRTIRKSGAKF